MNPPHLKLMIGAIRRCCTDHHINLIEASRVLLANMEGLRFTVTDFAWMRSIPRAPKEDLIRLRRRAKLPIEIAGY